MSSTVEPPALRYSVLGPLEVTTADGRPVEIPGNKPRALLCTLLLTPRQPISADRIIEALWGDDAPPAAMTTLQAYVSQLRRALEPGRGPRQPASTIVTSSAGYSLAVNPGDVDADRLATLLDDGEALAADGHPVDAVDRFDAALALVRGRPFADLDDAPHALGAIARLDQLVLTTRERRLDALLAIGRLGAAIADLEPLVAEHPLRERFWAQLIEALYRSDRQADALRAFQTCRRTLVDELGVEPSPMLRRLEQSILAHEPLTPETAVAVEADAAPVVVEPTAWADAERADAGDPLVGRAGEIDAIRAAIERAVAGRGSIVTIEGEAGIGKSRLGEEAMTLAERAGMATAWTACVDELGAPTLWPWEDALAALGHEPPAPPSAGSDDESAQFRRMLDVLSLLGRSSQQRPILLVIDDAQWADAASLQALRVLAGRLQSSRVVVVATIRRPDDQPRPLVDDVLATLGRQRSAVRLRLAGLDESSIGELIGHLMVGAGDPDTSGLAALVATRTGGNPFFVTEMLRLFGSERAFDHSHTVGLADVPDTVREVIERRLARLPEDTATLLRLLAVSKRPVELDLIQQATGLDAERIVTLMEAAVVSGLVVDDASRLGWRFAHALVHDAVRQSLGRGHRLRLHATLADALETLHGDDVEPHLDELALHNVEAAPLGRVDAGVYWATRAALHGRATGRHDVAVRRWSSALDIIDPAQDRQRFDLLLERARDRRTVGDTAGFGDDVAEAVALARLMRDQHRVALAASELGWVNLWNTRPYGATDDEACVEIEQLAESEQDPVLAARLFGAVGVELYYSPRRAHGEKLARRAVELARPLGDPVLLSRTLNNFVLAAWAPENDDDRLSALDESLALRDQGLPTATEAIALIHRSAIRLRRWDIAGTEADLARCRSLVTELSMPEVRAQLLYAECGLATLRAQWGFAARLADEAHELHARTNLWGASFCRLTQHACIADGTGRLDDLIEDLLAAADDPGMLPLRSVAVLAVARAGDVERARALRERWDWRDEPRDWSWDQRMGNWGEAAALLGSPDASELADALQSHAGLLRVGGTGLVCQGAMAGVLARLAVVTGDDDGAERWRDQAVAADRSVDGGWWAERLLADLEQLG